MTALIRAHARERQLPTIDRRCRDLASEATRSQQTRPPTAAVAVVGLVIWGLGLSVVFPQLYARAARLPGTSAGAGIGWMLLGQRFGAIVCAVAIGAIAEWQDLRVAFVVVCGAAMALLLVSLRRASAERLRAG